MRNCVTVPTVVKLEAMVTIGDMIKDLFSLTPRLRIESEEERAEKIYVSIPDLPAPLRAEPFNEVAALKESIEHLEHAFTPLGVVQWLNRRRHQLDGRTPIQALIEGDLEEVVSLAEGSRSSDAT